MAGDIGGGQCRDDDQAPAVGKGRSADCIGERTFPFIFLLLSTREASLGGITQQFKLRVPHVHGMCG
ncbi:hypothetical protein ACH79_15460 [Bradyrhizobium sp. CCBAU 051011]|nr:hypothetical protein ACH79_15460 [Bradyrhizobium sp. CCBAU 051011]